MKLQSSPNPTGVPALQRLKTAIAYRFQITDHQFRPAIERIAG